jgi:hypothetical protein
MSSAVGCPLAGAAGLVAVDVDDEVAVAGLSLGIEGALGEAPRSCASDGMTASVEQKRIVKEREVFMVAVFQDDAREVKRVCEPVISVGKAKNGRPITNNW